jgi:hypothetical protein
MPTAAVLMHVAAFLRRFDEFRARRVTAAEELIANSSLAVKRSSKADEICFMAVPFFSSERDVIIADLRAAGVPTYFLYGSAQELSRQETGFPLDVEDVSSWCRHILPVDPRFGRQFLSVTAARSKWQSCLQ